MTPNRLPVPETTRQVEASGPSVVDAHTHIFSPDVISGLDVYSRREPWFRQLYHDPRARLADAEDLLMSMSAAGIERSVICGFPWRDLGICREHNDYLAAAAERSGGHLAWLAIVPPHGGREAAIEARRALECGACGLGELNADAQGFDLRDAESLSPVVDVCRELDRPIMLHASEPVGHAYPGKGSATPEKLISFVTAFRDVDVVLAHWGGGLPFYELMLEVATALRRVVYDCAASTYLYRFDVFRTVLDLVGPNRVLFGSDYPVLGQRRFLARTLGSGIRPDELPAVLGENARRVYRLPPIGDGERTRP